MKTQTKPTAAPITVVTGRKSSAGIRSVEITRPSRALTVNGAIELWVAWLNKNARGQSALQSTGYIRVWARDAQTGAMPLHAIEEEHINAWVNADDGTKLGTRRVRLAIVRSFFKFLAIKELLTRPNPSTLASVNYNALPHAQKETKEIQPFNDAEFARVVSHMNDELNIIATSLNPKTPKLARQKLEKKRDLLLFLKSAIVISRCAGLRLGDVCQLEWDCIGKKFTVWTDKRNKRVQPHIWNQELFNETVAQIPMDSEQYCFPRQRSIYLDATKHSKINFQFSRLFEKLKIHGRTFNSLRHTYASECHRAGIPTPHIAVSMGHSNTKTTEGYIHQ